MLCNDTENRYLRYAVTQALSLARKAADYSR